MNAKHTPGPWTTGRAINTVDIGKFSFICPFGANSADQVAEIKANARLISAAPDLLAALESVTLAIEQLVDIKQGSPVAFSVRKARAAIAKAKGE